ncbi:uncharacterized protein LOC141942189 isoform X2 [Strix uralensis]|uniref:uncharacterized protein LOC141942189 isoform X2 n=1 Tax=Strix uralensis TaxID=36305 RepID=UPI003DA76266
MSAAPGPGCQLCLLGEKGTLQRWGSPGVPPPAAGFPPPAAGTGWFLLHSSFSEQLPAGQAPPAWHWLCQSWGELRPAGTGFHWVSALQPCPASSAQADAQGLELAALAKNVLQCEQRPLQGPAVSPAAPSVRGRSWPGRARGAAAVLVLPIPRGGVGGLGNAAWPYLCQQRVGKAHPGTRDGWTDRQRSPRKKPGCLHLPGDAAGTALLQCSTPWSQLFEPHFFHLFGWFGLLFVSTLVSGPAHGWLCPVSPPVLCGSSLFVGLAPAQFGCSSFSSPVQLGLQLVFSSSLVVAPAGFHLQP